MSKALTIYMVATLVLFIPAYLSARKTVSEGSRPMRVVAGVLLALGWPVTVPLLGISLRPRSH